MVDEHVSPNAGRTASVDNLLEERGEEVGVELGFRICAFAKVLG